MNARMLALAALSFGALAAVPCGRAATLGQGAPEGAFGPEGAQAAVDRLVREPWRYDGVATGAIALQTDRWADGPQPVRILIGLHPVAADVSAVPGPRVERMAGEIVALDAQSRPVAAAPIAGEIDRASGPRATIATCRLHARLAASDLVMRGMCGPSMLSGEAGVETSALARFAVDIGLASPPVTASEYWLGPLR